MSMIPDDEISNHFLKHYSYLFKQKKTPKPKTQPYQNEYMQTEHQKHINSLNHRILDI